ncbi:ribosome small subunit-dependent GTPase A [Oceanobacillus halotolerans]|uniref:ribosome small subunit-dependent GTPase A n=1 Tax=Oceanobacillus halotolerans TaxID=2663380 RepID=UPI0013D8E393|nr:ribosome small subunit-dependent GTPase A [Oceanobacillus halotolerans]
MAEGRIVKALSGFYYVKSGEEIYQCRGRGVFRKQKITPLVGDFVTFESTNLDEGFITDIKPRKNELIRPPIANIDQAIIVTSVVLPDFSPLLLDRFLVLIESKDIEPIIFISKMDALSETMIEKIDYYRKVYEKIGYPVELYSVKDNMNMEPLSRYLANNVSVIAGQSGVGKSSLLNKLKPSLVLETGEVSESLGRGKHTTRHVELVEINNGLVADTPGFSSLDFDNIQLEELGNCFPEIAMHSTSCKFRGCNHIKEPKCAVKQAVEAGDIASSRYDHYLRFYEEIQTRKPRY